MDDPFFRAWMSKYSGSGGEGSRSSTGDPYLDSFLGSTKARKKRRKDEDEVKLAEELKAEAQKQEEEKVAAESEDKRNIFQKVGGFVKDAGVGIWQDANETYRSTKDTIQGVRATHQMNINTDELNKNSKEWNAYMNSILGDAASADESPELLAKWNSAEVQEKLKEFKYKSYLIQGRESELGEADIPQSAKTKSATAPQKDTFGKDIDSQFQIGPNGSLTMNTPPVDPYQKYRDVAISDRTKQDMKEMQDIDAKKYAVAAASTFLNVATLGVGTGAKAGAKQGITVAIKEGAKAGGKQAAKAALKEAVGVGGKELAKNAAKDALVGGAFGVTETLRKANEEGRDWGELGLDDFGANVLLGASIGAAAPVVGKAGSKLVRGADTAAGRAVSEGITKRGIAAENEAMQRALVQIGEDGVMGTLNKAVSRAGRKGVYAVSDQLEKTKVGSKLLNIKDDFMSKWVTNFSPLYKTLKRADFEGKTEGAYLAAREAIGNSNRALSFAQDYIDNNQNMQQLAGNIAGRGKNLVKARESFDEFAKVRSELDLVAAGKKKFSAAKMEELEGRMAKFKDNGWDDAYGNLTNFYKDLNQFRLDNGLISQADFDRFADEGFDYVRQQRELPDWMLDKGKAASGSGSKASITKSDAIQKRNKFADAELLSPMETALRTAQLAHVEAYRNRAAKTVFGLLDEAGDAKLLRTTDMVREKQSLLKGLKESRPIAVKMAKTVRIQNKAIRKLETEMSNLSKEGLDIQLSRGAKDDIPEAFRYVTKSEIRNPVTIKGKKTQPLLRDDALTGTVTERLTTTKGGDMRKMVNALVTEDPARLKQIRKMIEARDEKLSPLFDTIETMNRDLHDLYAERSNMWQQAGKIKTDVKKGSLTSLSFLDDGVENIARIDPDIASAIHNWDKQTQNVMNNVLRFSNNVFKYGTTGANVGFALPNFVADQVGSAINSKNLMATHNPVNFVHSLFMTIGKPLNVEDAEILRLYRAGNKGQLNINQYTKSAAADKLANDVIKDAAGKGKALYTDLRNPKEAMRTLFDATEGAVGATENLTRIQNYRGTLRAAAKGPGTYEDAVRLANQAARENSVDFLEMGDYGRVINTLIPYFNAGIQGTRTMLRNASERPVSFAAKTTALVGAPIAATTIWNTGTEERRAIYDTIPEYVKETNLVVVGPNAKWNEKEKKWDGVYLMKKPPGFKEFAEPVRKFIEYKSQDPNAKLGDFFQDEGTSMAGDFSQAMTPIDFSDPGKFLSSVTPQILKPTAQAILNKEFFTGQDIVKGSMQDLPPEDQKYEQYSQLTAHLGALFNTSPLKVDSWIKNTFGEVGTNAQHYIDTLTGAPDEAIGGRSLTESVERRFVGAPGGADTDAFYGSYNPALSARKTASSKVTELVKAGRINEAKRRAEEYNASIKDRFKGFFGKYADSPNYDEAWDEKINDLFIKTSEGSFEARRRQK